MTATTTTAAANPVPTDDGKPPKNDDDDNSNDKRRHPPPSLNKLLAALASGARSVNSLPLTSPPPKSSSSSEHAPDEGGGTEDDFGYHMAFPEFHSLCNESRSKLASLLRYTLRTSCRELVDAVGGTTDEGDDEDDGPGFDDPLLWESATEACDLLLERVDAYVQGVEEGRAGLLVCGERSAVERAGVLAQKKAMGAMDRLLGSLVEMEKPQITYGFLSSVQNSRTTPFRPLHHPHLQTHPHLPTLLPGHGIDTRHYDGLNFRKPLPPDAVAPTHHYPHPYTKQIRNLEYPKWQLDVLDGDGERVGDVGRHGRGGTLHNPKLAEAKGVWIDTEEKLKRLVDRINGDNPSSAPRFREIAVDLEAHNYRSYHGFVCLMQIGLRRPTLPPDSTATPLPSSESTVDTAYDFLIDTLLLPRPTVNLHLAPIFASPLILKVMHGADSDVPWLQRDFGIYVVNLFDTGRAARILPLYGSYGLAFLLRRHAGVEADKEHQLSDWRRRPLTAEMERYAVSDVRYLLDVYDKVRLDLMGYRGGDGGGVDDGVSIERVLEASEKVCLIRHTAEPFRPDGYEKLVLSRRRRKRATSTAATTMPEEDRALLKKLYDWRDRTAREEDESVQYVCTDSGLKRIAAVKPGGVTALQGVIHPLPPLVLTYADQILHLVTGIESFVAAEAEPPRRSVSPAPSDRGGDATQTGGATSPVMGTDALFEQAGWMDPRYESGSDTDATPSTDDDDENRPNAVEVHPSNRSFVAGNYTSHSLEMGPLEGRTEEMGGRGRTVDGLGAARAIMDGGGAGTIETEGEDAKDRADRIREGMLRENLLGIVGSARDYEAVEPELVGNDDVGGDGEGMVVDEPIPKSMQDIYRISHRNRRRAKKAVFVPSGDDATESQDVRDLEEAEALLASGGPNGGGYFEDTETNKRRRTRGQPPGGSTTTDEKKTEADDVDLMVDLGWVKDGAEAELLRRRSAPDEIRPVEPKTDAGARNGTSGESPGGVLTKRRTDGARHGDGRGGRVRASERPVLPSVYSRGGGAVGIYDGNAPVPNNPFFTGAAVGGGTLNRSSRKVGGGQKKAVSTNNKKGKRGNGGGERLGGGKSDNNNKSQHAYRN